MVRLQGIGQPIEPVIHHGLHNEFTPLVSRQCRERALVFRARGGIECRELGAPPIQW